MRSWSLALSASDRRATLEILRNAQFVYGLSRYPKKQVLDDPGDVKALRERLEAMRAAAKGLSPAQREKLDVPWAEDRKSTRLNSSHDQISYAVFCLIKKN